ncbi:MAG TPA: V-type ATPase 116kDa subunit family protein, partial [Candidatus Brocadiia bacterium]|nr:V-type ATPase 116kDa subunit family protein [Candidatus Brocadiia bacterium]
MLRPEKMRLVTIYGERDVLPRLVDVLHRLGRVQLEAAPTGEDSFITRPISYSFYPVEGFLVQLRAIKEYLRLTPPTSPPILTAGDVAITLPEQMELLSNLVRERRERLDALDAQIKSAQTAIEEITPFIGLAAPLDLLKDNDSLAFVAVQPGGSFRLPADIVSEEIPYHFGATPARVFAVERRHADEFRQALINAGAKIISLPGQECSSTPAQRRDQLIAQINAARASQNQIRNELAVIAVRHAPFIYAAEEVLTSLVQKNNGAKRFASSEYAIAARFWAPDKDLVEVISRIHETIPTGVEIVIEPETRTMHHSGEEQERGKPQEPTRLQNPAWARPFETLTELFDVPSAREVDPSLFMAICFPLFFGFMVGDTGYGALMALAGWLILRRCGPQVVEAAHLAYILTVGGLAGGLFGFFVFGEMFGIPLHPEEGAVFSWSQVLPASLLPPALLLKTEPVSVSEMLLFSAIAGGLHMGVGCIFGALNEWPHSRRK